jgi:hypothetical protein
MRARVVMIECAEVAIDTKLMMMAAVFIMVWPHGR